MSRVRLAGLLGLLAAVLVAGCGAPAFTYVTNSGAHTYFKVPYGWHKIGGTALSAAANGGSASGNSGVWAVGYDASARPAAGDLLSSISTQPFAYAVVGQVNQATTNTLSYNGLRDFFLPVTSSARQGAAKSGFPLTGFKLLHDAMLTPGQGVHGVRVTFDYTYPDGSTDTFDQVALTNADDTEVYVLLVHCLATCYSAHLSQINTVMTSFTVRSP